MIEHFDIGKTGLKIVYGIVKNFIRRDDNSAFDLELEDESCYVFSRDTVVDGDQENIFWLTLKNGRGNPYEMQGVSDQFNNLKRMKAWEYKGENENE